MLRIVYCLVLRGNIRWYILPGAFSKGDLQYVGAFITIAITAVIWGRIAKRMGRSFWQYGLGSAFLLGIPALVLAFGPAAWKRDDYETPEPIYQPLPPYGMPVPVGPLPPVVVVGQSTVSIHCYMGELKGNTIPVPSEGIVIGRDPAKCQIVLSSNELSRTHASIMIDLGNSRSIVLRDMQSTNGTFQQVQDSRHESHWERINGSVVLGPGKRFRIGKGVAEFEVR